MNKKHLLLFFSLCLPLQTSAADDWKNVLKQLGVEAGNNVTQDQYDNLLQKLSALPEVVTKIQQSSVKPVPLADWIRILTGLGIVPMPDMADNEWALVLVNAGANLATQVPVSSPTIVAALPTVVSSTPVAAPVDVSNSVAPSTATSSQTATPVVAVLPVAVSSDISAVPAVPTASSTLASTAISSNESPPSVATSTVASLLNTVALVTPQEAAPLVATKKLPTLNLEVKGMDVMEVLKVIARQANLNLVIGQNVHGNVTLYLKDVDLWEGLRTVMESTDLAYVNDGSVVRIMTAADFERLYGTRFDDQTTMDTISLKYVKADIMSRYLDPIKSQVGKIVVYDGSNTLILSDLPEQIAKMKQMAQALDLPMETRIIPLNYAKAEDILPKLTPMVTKDIGDIEIDKRTNRIVVTDYADRIQPILTLVKAFDTQHRSVLIDAKIVNVTLSNQFQFGVNWGSIFSKVGNNLVPGGVTGNFTLFPIVAPGIPAGGADTTGPGVQGNTGVTASLGTLSNNNYTAIVQALQTVGKTDLIASPRISVVNNETANILVGTKEAYVTTTVTTPGVGAATTAEQVNFVDVGIKLFVSPVIGEDDYVTLKIKPEVSSVDRVITTAEGNTIPIVRTSQAETSVLLKNGETMLLAGLIQDQLTRTDSGVPFLSRIPLLGALFRSSDRTKTKTELTIFLTPHIYDPDQKAF